MSAISKPWAVLATCIAMGAAHAAEPTGSEGKVSFKTDVKPILDGHCVVCHHPGAEGFRASGLNLESYDTLMKGARRGAVVEPGSSASSILVRAVNRDMSPPVVMPHRNPPLPKTAIKTLSAWVDQGALDN